MNKYRAWDTKFSNGDGTKFKQKMIGWDTVQNMVMSVLEDGFNGRYVFMALLTHTTHGEEVYQGDVIEYRRPLWEYDPDAPWQTFQKVINSGDLGKDIREAEAVKDGRVVGNIFDNPEFLEGAV